MSFADTFASATPESQEIGAATEAPGDPAAPAGDWSAFDGAAGQLLALSVDAIVLVGPDNRIAAFNAGAEKIFGWAAEEIRGRPLETLLPARLRARHRAAVGGFLESGCVSRQMGERARVVGLHRSGREFPAAVTIIRAQRPSPWGYAAIVRDLTAETAARQALEKNERRLRSAQRIAGIGYWDLDLASRRLVWSSEVFRIFDIAEGDFDGTLDAFLARVHPDDRDLVLQRFQAALEGRRPYVIEHRILRPDGAVRTVMERGEVERDEAGRAVFVEGIVQDITRHKLTQQRLLQARNEALAASAAKSQFLTTMGHELRTPLNAINGFSKMLVDQLLGPLDARYHQYAAHILEAGEHLTGVINTVLNAARLEGGRMELAEEEMALAELLAGAAGLLEAEARRWGSSLVLAEGPRLTLRGDKQMLRQVLFNLVGNALKFSPRGSRIEIAATRRADGAVVLSVADEGPGIDLALVQAPIQPFVQGEAGLARNHEGLGLGLYLVNSIVKLHGGGLEFAHRPRGGTLARVILPAARVVGEERGDAAAKGKAGRAGDG